MHDLNVTLALAMAVVTVLGLLSAALKPRLLSVPLLALTAGIVAGPEMLGILDPATWPHRDKILEEAARFTLAISVMGIAIRTPVRDLRRLAAPVALLLTLGMLGMWLAGSLVAWGVLGLTPLVALLLGAIITPTDPVVASSIVTGRFAKSHLPDRLRSTLSLESGANDGLGYLFVLLPILLLAQAPLIEGDMGIAMTRWLVDVVLVGVLLAILIGVALGWLAGAALQAADHMGLIEEHSFLSFSVALSLLAVSGAKLAGSDGILAAFAAGIALNLTIDRKEEQAEENVQEAISKLFNLPIFVLLGLALPFAEWREIGWIGLLFAGLVLVLRRPPVVLALGPAVRSRLEGRDTAFLAWFGPIGVAALYYAMLAKAKTGHDLFPEVSLVIVASIVVHGITAAPLTRLHAQAARVEPEASAVAEPQKG
jgi:NhaP-type Na+/H+ or K+/H+ antiporter